MSNVNEDKNKEHNNNLLAEFEALLASFDEEQKRLMNYIIRIVTSHVLSYDEVLDFFSLVERNASERYREISAES